MVVDPRRLRRSGFPSRSGTKMKKPHFILVSSTRPHPGSYPPSTPYVSGSGPPSQAGSRPPYVGTAPPTTRGTSQNVGSDHVLPDNVPLLHPHPTLPQTHFETYLSSSTVSPTRLPLSSITDVCPHFNLKSTTVYSTSVHKDPTSTRVNYLRKIVSETIETLISVTQKHASDAEDPTEQTLQWRLTLRCRECLPVRHALRTDDLDTGTSLPTSSLWTAATDVYPGVLDHRLCSLVGMVRTLHPGRHSLTRPLCPSRTLRPPTGPVSTPPSSSSHTSKLGDRIVEVEVNLTNRK